MSNVIDRINKEMPEKINTLSEEYKAVFGKIDFIPTLPIVESSDYNCGAVSNELEFIINYIEEAISSYNPDNAQGSLLDKIILFMLNITRIYNESDASLLLRYKSFIRRNSNPRWETDWSLKDILKYFFSTQTIYIEDNYIETDLILNGGFESLTGPLFNSWSKSEAGSSTIADSADSFQDSHACKMHVDSSNSAVAIYQTINALVAGNYKFEFWYKDDNLCPVTNELKVIVQRSTDSYYYNFATNAWQAGAAYKSILRIGTTWTFEGLYINNTNTYNLTFTFQNDGAASAAYNIYLDRVKFGIWQDYPSVKYLIVFTQNAGQATDFSLFDNINSVISGKCEDITSPTLDTTIVLINGTWVQDIVNKYQGLSSWLLTKTTAPAGGIASVVLSADSLTTDLHGLTVNRSYRLTARLRSNAATIGNAQLIFHQYYSAAWHTTVLSPTNINNWDYIEGTIALNSAATGAYLSLEIATGEAAGIYVGLDNIQLTLIPSTPANEWAYASFWDQGYIKGEGSGYTSDYIQSLLNRAKIAGTKATFETMVKIT